MKQLAPYEGFRERVEKLKVTAETLTVTDVNDKAGMVLARTTRLALKEVRVAVTHRHRDLKAHILVEGRRIDEGKNELLALIEPLEARLEEQEKFIEREEQRAQDEKRNARSAELAPFSNASIVVDLGTMPDAEYAALLQDIKDAHAGRLARQQKEREEQEAKARAEAEERERIRLENEQLRKEAAEREEFTRKEREEYIRQAQAAKALADAEAKAIKDRALERERIIAEEARKERGVIEARERGERLAREQAEAELASRKAAEEKAAADRAKAERAAMMLPEKVKLEKFANDVRDLSIMLLVNSNSEHLKDVADGVERFCAWVEKKAKEL